ncbi:MAG: hypothetical protein AAF108_02420 [Planctomycetota bacterium]
MVTSVRLRCAPLSVSRRISLEGACVVFSYCVENTSSDRVPWLWCWHPLMRMPTTPRLELSGFGPTLRPDNGFGVDLAGAWLWPPAEGPPSGGPRAGGPRAEGRADLRTLAIGEGRRSVKLFAERTDTIGRVALADESTGSRLSIDLESEHLRGLGLWINRGGWNGYTHVALEPSTVPFERPTDSPGDRGVWLDGHAAVEFEMPVTLSTIG